MKDRLLSLDRITVRFGERTALDAISLQLHRDEIVTVIGPNGAGKSTLIKIALGLLPPSSGRIERSAQLRIGYMPQRLHIEPSLPLTVIRFMQLGGAGSDAAIAALDEVNMAGLARQPLQALSGGEMQRVLLARALLRQPDLLVLDEPAQGVDLAGQTEMYRLIAELRSRYHCGILMVSHDLHWVMAKTDKVICLNHHICCEGHPEQVGNDPAYQALFGVAAVQNMALYQHHHNHHHDLHGHVLAEERRDV